MTARAANRIFGVLMTRNDADILATNIRYHLAVGCERILVVDNGSSDRTPRLLKRLARRLPVEWTVDDGELRQPEIVTALAHDARAKGADWVIPLDTDEFWHPARPLAELCTDAAAAGAGALEAPRIEFIQARDQAHSTRRSPLRATMRVEQPLLGNEAVAQFVAGERSMFEVAPPPKLLMRTAPELSVSRGAHAAEGLAGPVEVSASLAIMHLPLRSYAEVQGRIEHAARIGVVESDPSISFQNRYWAVMAEAGRLD